MDRLAYPLVWTVRLIAAVLASVVLFSLVSLLSLAIGMGDDSRKKKSDVRMIVKSEMIRKAPENKPEPPKRLRKVSASDAARGKGMGQNPLAMRFSPDLSVDISSDGGAALEVSEDQMRAEVFEQGQTDEDAIVQHAPDPEMPQRAREQGVEGEVEVLFVITHQGKTSDIQVVRAPAPYFAPEIRRVISQWRFKPARNKGIPVNIRVRKVYDFRLD